MNRKTTTFLGALLLCLAGTAVAVDATVRVSVDATPAASAATGVVVGSGASAADDDDDVEAAAEKLRHHSLHLKGTIHGKGGDRTMVSIAHNQTLAAGHHADNVIGIMGNTTVAGDVSEDVVNVLGNLRVTGPVDGDVVAVLGNVYLNSRVDGDVVAVLGKVELGPDAEVGGEVNTVGGQVVHNRPVATAKPDAGARDASAASAADDAGASSAADVAGDIVGTQLDFADIAGADFTWLHDWVTQCLFRGRLLAMGSTFTWAWIVALVSLAFYVLTAFLLRDAINRYTRVLEDHPAESLFAGFLSLLATPVLMVLLCITVIGILAVPFLGIALIAAASFGKAVVLAWIGGRILRPAADGTLRHPALTVLVGGVVLTVLYAIPVVGMLAFQVTGLVGMGVAVYGLLLALRQKRQQAAPAPSANPAADPAAAAAAASAAALMPGAATVDAAAVAPAATVSPATAATYPRAGFWIRMFALFIDLVLVGLIAGLVLDSGKTHLVLLAIYGAVMWKLKGATLGNMICHLHVVRLDGRPLDWPTAVIRALSCFLSLFVVCLGFIWIAVDPERQAWHDKIAGTVVVRLPKGVSLV